MITSKQIKAARALAGMTFQQLATKANLSTDTITNIENEKTQAREGTIERIVKVFDLEGIEFTENEGLRRKPMGIEIFEGIERFSAFYDFMYEHLKIHGGDVCLMAADEGMLSHFRRDPEIHRKRMKMLHDAGKITIRILTAVSTFKSTYATYRKITFGNQAAPTSFYAFGKCLALISLDYVPAPYVVLHKAGPFADAFRHSFEIAWGAAENPTFSSNNEP